MIRYGAEGFLQNSQPFGNFQLRLRYEIFRIGLFRSFQRQESTCLGFYSDGKWCSNNCLLIFQTQKKLTLTARTGIP